MQKCVWVMDAQNWAKVFHFHRRK